jgi:hypothetical protein
MVRICDKGHIAGGKICWCKADADSGVILGGRRQPDSFHPKSKQMVDLRRHRHLTGGISMAVTGSVLRAQ